MRVDLYESKYGNGEGQYLPGVPAVQHCDLLHFVATLPDPRGISLWKENVKNPFKRKIQKRKQKLFNQISMIKHVCTLTQILQHQWK